MSVRKLAKTTLGAGLASAIWLVWDAGRISVSTLAWMVLLAATATAVASLAYCYNIWQRSHRHCQQTVTVVGTVGRLLPPPTRLLGNSPAVGQCSIALYNEHDNDE